jgi:thioredoxin 1
MENSSLDVVQQLQSQGKKILVDYWGAWCQPCKLLIPILENIQPDYPDVIFLKIDVGPIISQVRDMGITSVPTVKIYDGETLVSSTVGVKSENFYRGELNKLSNNE